MEHANYFREMILNYARSDETFTDKQLVSTHTCLVYQFMVIEAVREGGKSFRQDSVMNSAILNFTFVRDMFELRVETFAFELYRVISRLELFSLTVNFANVISRILSLCWQLF